MAAHEWLKIFQKMIKSSRHYDSYMVEQGIQTIPPAQTAAVEQPTEPGSEQAFLYVELWTRKEAWLNLGKEERQEFFIKVGGEV